MTISKISSGSSSSFMMSQFLVGGVENLFGGHGFGWDLWISEVIGGRSPNFGCPEILPR
jgi:hypothetical protein